MNRPDDRTPPPRRSAHRSAQLSTPLDAWLDRLAQPTGSPGGGAACGVMICIAASLLTMAAGYTPDDERAAPAGRRALELRTSAQAAAEADGDREPAGEHRPRPGPPRAGRRRRRRALRARGVVLDRDGVIASLEDAPPWDRYALSDARLVTAGDDTAARVYRAQATRAGDEQPFRALRSSTYRRLDGRTRLMRYQQTPMPNA